MAMVEADRPLEEKKNWLFRPYHLASWASVLGLVWLIPAMMYDDASGTAAQIAVALSLVFIAACLIWGYFRVERVIRGRYEQQL